MAYTFLKAQGAEVGTSLVDDTKLDYCKEMLEKAEKLGKKLLLPGRYYHCSSISRTLIDAEIAVEVVDSKAIPADMMGLDIGPKTAELYAEAVKSAKTRCYGTDRWVYSRTRSLQKEPSQVRQKHWLRPMLLPSRCG